MQHDATHEHVTVKLIFDLEMFKVKQLDLPLLPVIVNSEHQDNITFLGAGIPT